MLVCCYKTEGRWKFRKRTRLFITQTPNTMTNPNDNTGTTQNSAPDTKTPVTNTPSAAVITNNNAGQTTPGNGKAEAPKAEDRKDGKNNDPANAPDAARTTAGTGDTKTPQGSAT